MNIFKHLRFRVLRLFNVHPSIHISNVTPDNISQVESKLKELGYTPESDWNDRVKQNMSYDTVDAFADGSYELYAMNGENLIGFTEFTPDELFEL